MLRVRCAPDTALTIADALAKRPDTYWIGLASGGTEVLCLTRPRTRGDYDDLLLAKCRGPRVWWRSAPISCSTVTTAG